MKCPCHSGKSYCDCCQPYHEGQNPPNALALMRSRYCAYALGLVDYVMQTQTYPSNREDIEAFCKNTQFNGLEIISFIDGEKKAFVTFKAILSQQSHDASFTEKSLFHKNGTWKYTQKV